MQLDFWRARLQAETKKGTSFTMDPDFAETIYQNFRIMYYLTTDSASYASEVEYITLVLTEKYYSLYLTKLLNGSDG